MRFIQLIVFSPKLIFFQIPPVDLLTPPQEKRERLRSLDVFRFHFVHIFFRDFVLIHVRGLAITGMMLVDNQADTPILPLRESGSLL
jgi:hypothetical protein